MSKSKTYELMIKIAGKTDSSLKAACNTADKNLDKLGKTAKAVGKAAAAVAISTAIAVGTVGVASVKAAANYESQLSNVATLLVGTADEVTARTSEIGDQILDVSNRTGVATSDLTDGMYQVISAFGDSADASSILETAAKSAAAGNATTTDSINLLSAVTKGYGDTSAAAVQKAADLSFATVRLGQTTFPELAASLGKVIPLTSTLGVEQEQLFGAMATLTGVTGGTAEVSTQLKATMQSFLQPSASMTKALKSMGYESGQALLQSKGFQGSLEALKDSVGGDDLAFAGLFSSVEAQTAVLSLAGTQAENFTSKTAEMYESTGAANDAFETQTDNLNYDIQAIKTLGQNFLIQVGQKVLPYVKQLAEELLPVLQEKIPLVVDYVANKLIPAAIKIAKWISKHKVLIMSLAGVLLSLVGVFKVLQTVNTVVTTITSLKKVFSETKKAGGAMSKIFNVTNIKLLAAAAIIVGVIVGIILLVKAGKWLYQNWDKITAKAAALGAKVAAVWNSIKAWVTGVVDNLVDSFRINFPLLSAFVSGCWTSISAAVENIKAIFTNLIDFIKNVFTGNWSGAWENIVNIFGNLFGLIVNLAKAPINGVISAINWVLTKINDISFNLPDWKILGEWAGKTMGFSFPMIPALATGGVVTAPTLLEAGEGGEPEAVLPLSKLAALLDKWGNSKSRGGGNTNVGGDGITFAPVFQFYGQTTKEEAVEAGRAAYTEFKRLYKQMKAEERRKSFTPA